MAARRLAGVGSRQVLRALERAGFKVVRITGSHHVMRKPGVPTSKVIIPVHGAKDVPPGTLRSILAQAGMTVEEFMALL